MFVTQRSRAIVTAVEQRGQDFREVKRAAPHGKAGNSDNLSTYLRGSIAWLIWLAAAIWLTWPGFLWEIQYFRGPGPQFLRLLLFLLAASPIAAWVYNRVRRLGFQRWEFAAIAALTVAAALACQPAAGALTLVVLAACFSFGRCLRVRWGICAAAPLDDIVISCGLGLGSLHCVLFLLGVAAWYWAWAFVTCLVVFLLLGRRDLPFLWIHFVQIHRAWGVSATWSGWLGTLAVISAIAFGACSLLVILAPSLAYDVLRIHLPLAHSYAAQHALHVPPYLSYGYFPQGVETLMTLGYALAGDPAAQMLPPVYFMLTLLAAFRIGRLCGLSRPGALAGVLFIAATPVIHWTGSVPKNDLAVAFFTLAALLVYLIGRQSGHFQNVLAGAFFLAMAVGIKFSVVYAIPPLVLLFSFAAAKQPRPWRAFLKLAVILLVFGAIWPARTWLITGNPAYPFTPAVAVSTKNASGWEALAVRCLRLPWEIHFHGRAYFESPLEYPMGIALVLFFPVWVLAWRKLNPAERACLFFCALYVPYWAVVQGEPRFAIAPICILLVLTAGRIFMFCRGRRALVRFSLFAASAYALLFGLLGAAITEINAPQFKYLAHRIDRQEYLRETLAPYSALEFLKSVAHPGDPVLSVAACPLLYAPDPAVFDCVWPAEFAGKDLPTFLQRREDRFLILPMPRTNPLPPGWHQIYSDKSYSVYARDNSLGLRNKHLGP